MAVPESKSRAGALVRVPMSWEEYEALQPDARCEYVRGCLVVNPRAGLGHQFALFRLAQLLDAAVAHGYQVYPEGAWKPGPDEWGPDIMVVPLCRDVRFTGTPELIVEVLSTNRARDLVMKSADYASAGLPRYWVLDPDPDALQLTAFELRDGIFEEVCSVGPDDEVALDFGVGTVTLNLRQLLAER